MHVVKIDLLDTEQPFENTRIRKHNFYSTSKNIHGKLKQLTQQCILESLNHVFDSTRDSWHVSTHVSKNLMYSSVLCKKGRK